MSWKVIDRNAAPDGLDNPVLSDALQEKIRSFFDRYATKRAAILPALHMIQDDHGHIGWAAMKALAELLDIPASDVFDTVSFYTYFWTHPRGRKVVTVCRSITCEVLGGGAVLDACREVLGIDEHETTADGRYSLVTEECLACCDHGPCLFVNEKVHKRVDPSQVRAILERDDNDRLDVARSELYDGVGKSGDR